MNLGYAKLEGAKDKVLSGVKITSIREDKQNRWKVGMKIHHAMGVRTKKYKCFLVNTCTLIQEIIIDSEKRTISIDGFDVDILTYRENIAINDGFDSLEDFFVFFQGKKNPMKLIHWTDMHRYYPYDMVNGLPF